MGKTKNFKNKEHKALSIAHPNSRKATKLAKQAIREEGKKRQKIKNAVKRNLFGEKLFWFKENLEEGVVCYTAQQTLELFDRYLKRFDEELEQIKLKHSIGQRKNRQHASREDCINMTVEKDKNEFFGGGIEMVDIMHPPSLSKLKSWDGNMGYLNQMKMKYFTHNFLTNYKDIKNEDPSNMELNNTTSCEIQPLDVKLSATNNSSEMKENIENELNPSDDSKMDDT